jgi:hypothetical protein
LHATSPTAATTFSGGYEKTKVVEIAFCLKDLPKHQFAITVTLTNAPEA